MNNSNKGRAKLKIAFMGPSNSIHLYRWIGWFLKRGHEIILLDDNPVCMPRVKTFNISGSGPFTENRLQRYMKGDFNVHYIHKVLKSCGLDLVKKTLLVRKILDDVKPDILHLHTLFDPYFVGVFLGFHPLVVTPWNGDIVWRSQWSLLRKIAVKIGLSSSDLITVDSDELEKKVLRYGKYESKVEHVSFGVDTSIFNPTAKAANNIRKKLNISDSAPIVLSARSFEGFYNIDIIISSIPLILRELPNTIFIFSWHSASQEEKLVKLVHSMGLEKNVRFVGKISSRSELAGYYAEADVCVSIPSGDTIAISLLEAMACGAAPVISDLPSPRECITHNINGYIVPARNVEATASAIKTLLGNKELRKKFSDHNLPLIKDRFEWDANMRKVENSYYGLLDNKT